VRFSNRRLTKRSASFPDDDVCSGLFSRDPFLAATSFTVCKVLHALFHCETTSSPRVKWKIIHGPNSKQDFLSLNIFANHSPTPFLSQSIRHGVKLNTVDKLKQILSGLNDECGTHFSRTGKKQDLIDRIANALDSWRNGNFEDKWLKAKSVMQQVRTTGS